LPKVATSMSLLGSFTCRKARHGTDGFTSRRKEGVLRIFSLLMGIDGNNSLLYCCELRLIELEKWYNVVSSYLETTRDGERILGGKLSPLGGGGGIKHT
jgi:hypothetical protein